MTGRRDFLAAGGALALGAALPMPAQAQLLDTAKLLVGFVPGGLSDTMARRLADKLRGRYATSVVVENRPGASGQIAITQLKESSPDGTTVLITHSSALAMYPFTFAKLPYDPIRDLQPVSLVCYTNHALAVGPAVPDTVRNVKEFLAWTKANPDRANYGSPGVGSMPHLIMTVVNKVAGADLRPVAYRGTAAAITDLLAGQIPAASGPVGNFLPQVKAGKLRLIALSGDERSSVAPEIPTYREQGFPMTAREWYGLYVPARCTPAIVAHASSAARAALADAGLLASLRESGVDPGPSTPDELAAMLRADTEEWRRLTKEIGFTAES